MPPKNDNTDDDSDVSSLGDDDDDFIKGVPQDDENEGEFDEADGSYATENESYTSAPAGAPQQGPYGDEDDEVNVEGDEYANDEEGNAYAGEEEGEGDGGYPSGGGAVYGEDEDEDGLDPYAGAAEEGDVDVEGDMEDDVVSAGPVDVGDEGQDEDEEEEDGEEDDVDVDVDDDTEIKPKSRIGKVSSFEDSDLDTPRASKHDSTSPSVNTPNYQDDDDDEERVTRPKEVKLIIKRDMMVASTPVTSVASPPADTPFEPEYEPLDFEHGNILHKEAFYGEWEKTVNDQSADESGEILVPIRVDVVVENHRVQDTFIWNLKEKSITPDQYAEMLCVDLDLPSRAERQIADAIRQQLAEHRAHMPTPPRPTAAAAAPPGALPECLVTIKVDLTVNNVLLRDQFEWDVNNPTNAPEPFARALCQDLGLSREFETSIAHAIREQLAYHAQYTVPILQQTHARTHVVITPERCVREERDLPQWTPAVSTVVAQRPVPQGFGGAGMGGGFGGFSGASPGPVRHSSRLLAASLASPYGLRAATTTPAR